MPVPMAHIGAMIRAFRGMDICHPNIYPKTKEPAIPNKTPMIPPSRLNITASLRNCICIAQIVAPTASRRPISFVHSVTDTSITFIIPIPPTRREIEATLIRKNASVWFAAICALIISSG